MSEQDLLNDDAWVRGADEEFSLFITDRTGAPQDLTGSLVEMEIKKSDGDADPAALHLDSTATMGLTIPSQTGPNVGLVNGIATKAQTFALAAGTWRFDVFVTVPSTLRKRALHGRIALLNTPNDP